MTCRSYHFDRVLNQSRTRVKNCSVCNKQIGGRVLISDSIQDSKWCQGVVIILLGVVRQLLGCEGGE
ncbi:hypothetical protein SUGI_0173140 [Cryptomeria japonica]|nr:hypothetical protein SUGI_0173140 [Cryptomeria japonica]